MTVDDLVEAFGGNVALADIAGVGSTAVSNWRKAGRIPPRLYLRLAAAGRALEIEVPGALFEEVQDARRTQPERAA